MGLVFTPVLFVALVLYVAWPLMKEDSEGAVREGETTDLEVAFERKDAAVASLKDIDMDYRTGKLSDEDYQNLTSEFEGQAVDALKRLEQLEKQFGSRKRQKKRKA